jgi:hypothetical protein
MYTKGKFKPQIKLDSKSYVVLCYAKSKRNWFTEDNYRQFQLNRAEFVKDISRSFDTLSKFGYIAKHEANNKTTYRITADGDTCLRVLGQKRKDDLADMLRENGVQSNFGRSKKNQINLSETPLTSN